jgi:hypothetical protein
MDPNGRIYEGTDIPGEDKARLDGFLRGRAEADAVAAKAERVALLEQRLADEKGDRDAGQ